MKNNSEEKALLRKKAEELLDRNQKQNGQFSSEADTKKLLHELQVHQIELEMINEELRLAKDKAAADAVIYQELYEFAPSGYISLLPDGTVVQLNFSSARMLGMERPMLINRNFRFLIAEDCRAELNDFFVQIFQRNALASCELQLSLEGKPDTFVYLEGHAADKGEKCNVTMIDITQRRLAEDRLKATLDALERSNAELGQFAYVASHDLQEPLRMVSNYTTLLERKFRDTLDEKTSQYMEFIIDGAKRMQSLIRDLLLFSRISSKKSEFVSTDLNKIIEEVLKDLQPAILESKAELKADKLPVVKANPTEIKVLFYNLIENAIKFKGTTNPVITITQERKEKKLIFCVKDNGIGIDPEYSGRIFMIFQRLNDREKYPGTGIGLALCRKVVENHGGRIWVESEEGKGAAFYFTIPDQ